MPNLVTGAADGGTHYTVELAFDWDAGAHPTVGFFLLQVGLVVNDPNSDQSVTASFASGPRVGDSLSFVLYDNSETTVDSGNASFFLLENVEIWFAPTRDNQGATSPFGVTTGLATRPRSRFDQQIDSTTYGKALPAWPLFPTSDPSVPTAYRLEHSGRFFLSARLSMTSGDETRVYRVDPEMIINSDGSGGGG